MFVEVRPRNPMMVGREFVNLDQVAHILLETDSTFHERPVWVLILKDGTPLAVADSERFEREYVNA